MEMTCTCGHAFESHCNAACVQGCYECACGVFVPDRKARIRYGWLLAIVLGTFLGLRVSQCGMDNRPEAHQDGGEQGPTGRTRPSLGRVEDVADDRPGFIIASGRLGETVTLDHRKYWNVGGVTLLIAPNQMPGDLRLRELDGRVVELVIREVH